MKPEVFQLSRFLAVLTWLCWATLAIADPLVPGSPPTACTIASCPVSVLTNLGSGVATALTATLNGSGALTATTNPAFVTPTLGVATATSLAVGGATLGTSNLVVPAGSAAAPSLAIGNSTTGLYSVSTTGFGISINGVSKFEYNVLVANGWYAAQSMYTGGNFLTLGNSFIANNAGNSQNLASLSTTSMVMNAAGSIGFSSSSTAISPLDTILTRKAAATMQLGAADAATSVAQTISFQGIVAGTSNTSGSTATITGSLSTGSGTSGDIDIRTGGTGAGATVQNSSVSAIRIKGATQQANFGGIINPANGFTPTAGSGAASVAGNDQIFVVTAGTAQTSITVNFGHTWAAAPNCTISTNSTASVVDIASVSTTVITFGASVALTGALINTHCFGA